MNGILSGVIPKEFIKEKILKYRHAGSNAKEGMTPNEDDSGIF